MDRPRYYREAIEASLSPLSATELAKRPIPQLFAMLAPASPAKSFRDVGNEWRAKNGLPPLAPRKRTEP